MRHFRDLDPRARLYVSIVSLLGLGLIPLTLRLYPLDLHKIPELIYLGIGIQVGALMQVTARGRHWIIPPLLVATGLVAPGSGAALIPWVFMFDGRMPGRDIPWWALFFNRAMTAVAYAVPSMVVAAVHLDNVFQLPLRTVLFAIAALILNYGLMAVSVVLVYRTSFSRAIAENVPASTLRSMFLLCLTGGILYAVLQQPGGYILAPVFWGLLFAVRSNIIFAEQQVQERVQTLQLAAQALDARDPYTESHSERVAQLAVQIGEKLDLSARELEQLRTAASLHDIGKIGIRDNILNKPSALTGEEWEIMKKHPDIGADMIKQHSALARLAPAVRHHHERWDGTGYPSGLREHQIPLGARIISVADGFDTITSVRSYRHSVLTRDEAVENITTLASKWYDPAVVDALRQIFGLPRLHPIVLPQSPPFHPVGALRLIRLHPRFGVLAAASGISAIGDPLTTVAILVSIYAATRQPLAVAASFAIQALATLVVSGVLGGLADRIDRRRMIGTLELLRGTLLLATPLLLVRSVWLILPVAFTLAAVNGLVQPARQATVPELVDDGQVGPANAVVWGINTVAQTIGFPVAGLILWFFGSTDWLFRIDAISFVIAAMLVLTLGDLGGGRTKVKVSSALRRAWSMRPARAYLLVTAAAVFFISMSFPALVVLGYHLWKEHGAASYTILETALSIGVVIGSVIVGRMRNIGSMRTVALGVGVMGAFSIGVGLSNWLVVSALLLLIASLGNSLFAVASQTALLELGESTNRGSLMVSRFGITQIFLVLGVGVGGSITKVVGPNLTFAVLGAGLVLLAAVAATIRQSRIMRIEASPPHQLSTEPQARAAG